MDGIIGRSLVGNKLKRICLQNHVAESLRTMRNKPPSQHASASATKADDTVGSHFAEAPVKDPCMHHTSAVQRLLVPSCLLIGSQPPSQLITTTPSGGFFLKGESLSFYRKQTRVLFYITPSPPPMATHKRNKHPT
jgi:hypothetical protein